jgi:diguanylate cyclase (GGDEF)-like protein
LAARFGLRGVFFARRFQGGSLSSFAVRLAGALALTLVVMCVGAYLAIDGRLGHRLIQDYAEAQRADVRGFEDVVVHEAPAHDTIEQIDRLLDAIGRRPGTVEATLINSHYVVVAAGEHQRIGVLDFDPRIKAALTEGRSYAGHEGDPNRDRRNFEFVMPVNLPSGRYAYELSYSHLAYDRQMGDVLSVLVWVGVLGLFGGALVFYLAGGRTLLRDHRRALQRATRDALTDLPNHRAFGEELIEGVAAAERYGNPLSLLLLDVDDFKLINDRHGHPHGDAVLKRVAQKLRESRPADRPFRIGGDEFAMLLAHTDTDGARTLARRLAHKLEDAGVRVTIGVSSTRPGSTADTLRAEADAALYEGKRHGGNRATHFAEIAQRITVTTSETKDAVRRLIDERRLTTAFQPIWDLRAGKLLGVEALMRPDPCYGLLGPAQAFDVAEQLGCTHELDKLCVRSALQTAPQLAGDVLLFLNLAPLTLDLDADGDDWLCEQVERTGVKPEQIVIEVTERFGGRTASVVKCLQRLREKGFKIAIDDVGTGNSGLEMLSKLSAEFVKLDRSIVATAPTEPGARAVLMAMATFAHQTGAFVIAEGIEDDDTLQYLHAIDQRELASETLIKGGQGFSLGRPTSQPSPDPPAALQNLRRDTSLALH